MARTVGRVGVLDCLEEAEGSVSSCGHLAYI